MESDLSLSLNVNNGTNSKNISSIDDYKIEFLKSWENGLKRINFSIIHSIRGDNRESPLLQTNANVIFSEWDVISCSLVDYANRGDVDFSSYGNGVHPIHLELDVPIQNILGTHINDVAFPNHAGRKWGNPTGKVLDSSALTRHIFNGINRFSLKIDSNKGYNQLIHFQDFIIKGFRPGPMGHNEILLIGRPNVNFYISLPCTGKIKLKGISYVPAHLRSCYFTAYSSGGIDFAVRKVSEQVEIDIQTLRNLTKLNNISLFTSRLYNSKDECFKILDKLLFKHFGKAECGVYRI
ncbi:hypothetical protein ACGVWS_10925 [Enterobacteriaceae bacterium LUAb1]